MHLCALKTFLQENSYGVTEEWILHRIQIWRVISFCFCHILRSFIWPEQNLPALRAKLFVVYGTIAKKRELFTQRGNSCFCQTERSEFPHTSVENIHWEAFSKKKYCFVLFSKLQNAQCNFWKKPAFLNCSVPKTRSKEMVCLSWWKMPTM